MSSKPGRRRGGLRGDYAEVRELAGVLRDIADSHGLTLRDLEERMPYARTSISQRLSGESRPEWKFVASFLAACTGGDRQAAAILERRVRPLWESAAPGRASRLAPAPPGALPADVGTWVTAMRETAAAQQVVARLQLSASRSMSTVQGLMLLIEKLASAARALAEERDALRLELLARSDTASELLRTRVLLDDTQHRLEAAELLLAQTSRRLDVAQRQREEADRLKDVAVRQVGANRRRLAEIEQHAIAFAHSIRAEARPALIDATLMDAADQSLAAEILSRVDEALNAEASTLDQMQGKLASASADNGQLSEGQQRTVPAGLAAGSTEAPADPMIRGTAIRPASLSAIELREAMRAGRLASAALTRHCLNLIEALNPVLHAVISVSPDALKDAAASDQRWSSGQPRGPLEGIPVLVKDNIQVAGMPTTVGSPALAAAYTDDAFIVSRLRAAGAVILAKTNMSEWANFRSYHSTHGWSTLGGQAVNPYAPDRSPSGSSSGSASGVSAGLAPLAVGTETDGSIVSPASMCGVVGIKPTLGLVSRTGIVPLSVVQDTAGPIAASVADAALLLSVLAADDPHDHSDAPGWARSQTDFTSFLDPQAIQGARLGIWRAAMKQEGTDKTLDALDALVKQLRSLGANVTDPVELPDIDKITGPEFAALEHEFKYSIDTYLGNLAASSTSPIPGSLTELIEFNRRNAATILSRFGQDAFESANRRSGNLADPEYQELRGAAVQMAVKALQAPVEQHRLDAVVSLTANPASLIDYVLSDHSMFGTSRPAAVAGWPAISLPFAYVHGLPVGVTFTGPRWSEPRLIALAYAFENATAARRPPILLPSVSPD